MPGIASFRRVPGLAFALRASRKSPSRASPSGASPSPAKTRAISRSVGSSAFFSSSKKADDRSGGSGEVSFPNSRRISSWRFSRLAVDSGGARERASGVGESPDARGEAAPLSPSLSSSCSTPSERNESSSSSSPSPSSSSSSGSSPLLSRWRFESHLRCSSSGACVTKSFSQNAPDASVAGGTSRAPLAISLSAAAVHCFEKTVFASRGSAGFGLRRS
mmetsp:Transcript_12659/g.54215  ORF Transcript_12659/g.54215 Transcript_12659/m.54215 type:complete len:219 (+) Transcript_12659:818-1474(+)